MYSDKCPFYSLEVLGIYASLLGMQISYAVNGVLIGKELLTLSYWDEIPMTFI